MICRSVLNHNNNNQRSLACSLTSLCVVVIRIRFWFIPTIFRLFPEKISEKTTTTMTVMDWIHRLNTIDWHHESYPDYQDFYLLPCFALFFPSLRFFLDRFLFEVPSSIFSTLLTFSPDCYEPVIGCKTLIDFFRMLRLL